jgi:hypothetical protein
MWQKYFSNAKIFGIDNLEGLKFHYPDTYQDMLKSIEKEGFTLFTGNQDSPEFLSEIMKQMEWKLIDIIIDDGSHKVADQKRSFSYLFPSVKPGGFYVIEDLFSSYHREFINQESTTVNYLKDLIDELNMHGYNYKGFYQDTNRPTKPSYCEENIESMTFYKSMCFIRKKK